MKKLLIPLLALCLSLAGCGKKEAEPTAEESSNDKPPVSTSIVVISGHVVGTDPGSVGPQPKNKAPTEEEKKFAEIMARAKANDAEAQFELGKRYYIGKMGAGRYGGNPVEQEVGSLGAAGFAILAATRPAWAVVVAASMAATVGDFMRAAEEENTPGWTHMSTPRVSYIYLLMLRLSGQG